MRFLTAPGSSIETNQLSVFEAGGNAVRIDGTASEYEAEGKNRPGRAGD